MARRPPAPITRPVTARSAKLAALALVALVGLVAASEPTGRVSVTDGDTIRIGDERIRILNIDAPEMGGGAECEAERMLALASKDRLTAILATGELEIDRQGQDRFGRTLAMIRVSGTDVGEMLIAAHVAVPWAGRQHDWC